MIPAIGVILAVYAIASLWCGWLQHRAVVIGKVSDASLAIGILAAAIIVWCALALIAA